MNTKMTFQPMSRAWGLTLDAVIGHEAVLADGSIIETSVTNNTDMFWALRGAGADFAIITKYRLQTQAAPSNNTCARIATR